VADAPSQLGTSDKKQAGRQTDRQWLHRTAPPLHARGTQTTCVHRPTHTRESVWISPPSRNSLRLSTTYKAQRLTEGADELPWPQSATQHLHKALSLHQQARCPIRPTQSVRMAWHMNHIHLPAATSLTHTRPPHATSSGSDEPAPPHVETQHLQTVLRLTVRRPQPTDPLGQAESSTHRREKKRTTAPRSSSGPCMSGGSICLLQCGHQPTHARLWEGTTTSLSLRSTA